MNQPTTLGQDVESAEALLYALNEAKDNMTKLKSKMVDIDQSLDAMVITFFLMKKAAPLIPTTPDGGLALHSSPSTFCDAHWECISSARRPWFHRSPEQD